LATNPDVRNGHIDIANEIAEAFAKNRISGEEWQVLWVIIRHTWGWHKSWDKISLNQFSQETGIKKPNILRALQKLIEKNIVVRKDNKNPYSWHVNSHYDTWNLSKSSKKKNVINTDNVINADNIINTDNKSPKSRTDKEKRQNVIKKDNVIKNDNGVIKNDNGVIKNDKIQSSKLRTNEEKRVPKETITKETITKENNIYNNTTVRNDKIILHHKKKQKKKEKINFNFDKEVWENITPKDKERWREAYPACDINIELAQMREWLLANPEKKKKNYRRFITNWLSRSQERGGTKKRKKSVIDRELERLRREKGAKSGQSENS